MVFVLSDVAHEIPWSIQRCGPALVAVGLCVFGTAAYVRDELGSYASAQDAAGVVPVSVCDVFFLHAGESNLQYNHVKM